MFLLKKIVAPFLFPIPLILLISLAGLWLLSFTPRKKTGKVLVLLGIMLLALLSFAPLSNRIIAPLEHRYGTYSPTLSQTVSDPVAYVVVLGGGHVTDPSLPVTSRLSSASLIRLVEGIRVCRKNPGSRMIVSGGAVFDPHPEAQTMAEAALVLGMERDDIIMEADSKDTKDQARFIAKIVGTDHFVLVTSASHMPRAVALFQKAGMDPIPAPAGQSPKKRGRLSPGHCFPNASALQKSERAFYEYLGILWAKLRGQI